jgi:hypothetical protein
MAERRTCDFCGRSERELSPGAPFGVPVLALDQDELWVCYLCRKRLVLPPVGQGEELAEGLEALVGKSAGAICLTLNLPDVPPYSSVIEAAAKIAYDEDRYMSAWSFVTQWLDGTTVWRAEDGSATAMVAPDGSVRVEQKE